MGSTPQVSVVVATFNRAARLERLLAGLRAQTLPAHQFEVVVVDDGSTDSTAELLRSQEGGELALRVIRQPRNTGRAAARQAGWQAAEAPIVAFTDDDCVPAPQWLAEGLAACRKSPGAIVQGRTDPDPAELDELGPFTRTVSVPAYDAAFQTCNIFYPREALEAVGGFDVEAFDNVHGGEDSDLAWRAIKAGTPATFHEPAQVFHAVNRIGALGKLRVAAGWSLLAYARHPELRHAHFANSIFWKHTHIWLVRAFAGALVARPRAPLTWLLTAWLALPWLRSLHARGKLEGGGPAMAPFYAACDVAELYACIRNSARYRTLIL